MQKNQPKLLATKALQQIMGGGKDTSVNEIQALQAPVTHIQEQGILSIIGTTTAEEGTVR